MTRVLIGGSSLKGSASLNVCERCNERRVASVGILLGLSMSGTCLVCSILASISRSCGKLLEPLRPEVALVDTLLIELPLITVA